MLCAYIGLRLVSIMIIVVIIISIVPYNVFSEEVDLGTLEIMSSDENADSSTTPDNPQAEEQEETTTATATATTEEICDNGIDDDGNGLTDAEDTDICPTPTPTAGNATLTPPPSPSPSPSPISKASSNSRGVAASFCNCVIFRIDDIADYWVVPAKIATMDAFISKNQSVSLALVMNHVGNNSKIVEKISEGVNKGLFELAIHGWDHIPYTHLSEEEQKNSLYKANEKMRLLFGNRSDIFVPPENLFNDATLKAMNQLGFKILSSDPSVEGKFDKGKSIFVASDRINYNNKKTNQSIFHVPRTISFKGYDENGNWSRNSAENILGNVTNNIRTYGYAVILLHPQDFMKAYVNGTVTETLDKNQVEDLSQLIDSVLSKNIHITSFSRIVGIEPKSYSPSLPPSNLNKEL
jgi:peptidoglycan/xylan/chitin deacetylase (PgdA/CDA1 family)